MPWNAVEYREPKALKEYDVIVVGAGHAGIEASLGLSFAVDECEDPAWSPSNFADRPVFAVTLVHGERWLVLTVLSITPPAIS